MQLTDVSVIWNYAPGVDVNNANHATLSSLGTKASGTHVIDLMSDTEFIENHYKIVSNKNRVYVRVAATVTAESKSYVNYSRVVEVIVNDIR
ncbi:hypothetical protein [Bacteroides sp.]|uniref:hypothetical protein n=1 Tax=Bacteroides sp. TaxID=29523 RepID=UPI0039964DF2